ncbi:MAG: dTMP kinase [Candidatus Binatus sp.]
MREKDRPLIETAGSPGGPAALELLAAVPSPSPNGHAARSSDEAKSAPRTLLETPHPYRGRLICVEGIDGSGKSTQLLLLERWLRARGYPVHFTEWNSSRLVRRSMQRGKKKNLLTPTTFSLLHAVDFADRLTYQILPPLKAGMIVLADRYVYTAFARDVARGVHPDWVRSVYSPALRPDLTLYFRVPIDVSLERLLSGRAKLKYHEAGMDVGLSADPVESFRMFQSRVLEIYDQLTLEFGMRPIDATGEIPNQQRVVRTMVQEILRDYDRNRADGKNGKNGVTSKPR